KDPNQTQLISIQRQYNALNVSLFNPDLPYPDVAGVCRHASTLVSDFLAQCGFDSQVIDQVQYRTHDAGHSTVRVTDPKTNKTYFLNWGELKELEGGGLVNFDIPSDSLQGYGMFIALMEPNEKGKFRGNTRTNEGVVMARLL